MRSVWLRSVCGAGLVLALAATAGSQPGTVSATISGKVFKRSDNSGIAGRTVNATCTYQLAPSATFSTATDASGNYTLTVQADVSGSNCIVKASPCVGASPIQRTVNVPPAATGVNLGCSS